MQGTADGFLHSQLKPENFAAAAAAAGYPCQVTLPGWLTAFSWIRNYFLIRIRLMSFGSGSDVQEFPIRNLVFIQTNSLKGLLRTSWNIGTGTLKKKKKKKHFLLSCRGQNYKNALFLIFVKDLVKWQNP
jgi:hypothetical protein